MTYLFFALLFLHAGVVRAREYERPSLISISLARLMRLPLASRRLCRDGAWLEWTRDCSPSGHLLCQSLRNTSF